MREMRGRQRGISRACQKPGNKWNFQGVCGGGLTQESQQLARRTPKRLLPVSRQDFQSRDKDSKLPTKPSIENSPDCKISRDKDRTEREEGNDQPTTSPTCDPFHRQESIPDTVNGTQLS